MGIVMYSTQSEAGIIATILNNPSFILHSNDYLKASHFYHKENGCLYWAIDELYKKGVDNVDAFNITTMLNSNVSVKSTIEQHKIPNIEEYIETSVYLARDTVEEYNLLCKEVFSFAYRRELTKEINYASNLINNEKLSTLDVKNKIQTQLDDLSEKFIIGTEIKTIGKHRKELWNSIVAKRHESGYGILSKYPIFNNYFSYDDGELYVIKARMKRGKSALLMNEAINLALNGIGVLYFDTEMSDELFYLRMLSNISGVDMNRIKRGDYTDQEASIIDDANELIDNLQFVHIYDDDLTNEKVFTTTKVTASKIDLGIVFYDYIKADSTKGASELSNILGEQTNFLKNKIAGHFKLPCVSAVQLNRNEEVADSDKIERYVTVSIKWGEKTSEQIAKDGKQCGTHFARIDLNRIGDKHLEDEYIDFLFTGSCMRIEQTKEQHSLQENPY